KRDGINLVFQTRAFRNLPPSTTGPFPVVVFSHGFGGWRSVNSSLVAGVASWGFVIGSPDYLERGLNAVATNSAVDSGAKDQVTTMDTLALLRAQNAQADSLLARTMDPDHIAVMGHSAGGRTALDALADPEVDLAIGYAAAGGSTNAGKP